MTYMELYGERDGLWLVKQIENFWCDPQHDRCTPVVSNLHTCCEGDVMERDDFGLQAIRLGWRVVRFGPSPDGHMYRYGYLDL